MEAPHIYSIDDEIFTSFNEQYYSHNQEYGFVRRIGPNIRRIIGYSTGNELKSDTPIFISPEEVLIAVREGKKVTDAIWNLITEVLNREVDSIDNMNILAKELWDHDIKREKIGDWIFNGIDVIGLISGLVSPIVGFTIGSSSLLAKHYKNRSTSPVSGLRIIRDINRQAIPK